MAYMLYTVIYNQYKLLAIYVTSEDLAIGDALLAFVIVVSKDALM